MNAALKSGPAAHRPRPAVWTLSICLGLWSVFSHAEESDPADRVARISYLIGHVYVQTTDDSAWNTANINQPLTNGDQLWTDRQARSELQMGRTAVQVDENSQLRLLELSDEVLQLQITQGVVNVRVRSLGQRDTVEIDTPNAAVSVMEPGTYRIAVAEHDELIVVQVRQGSVEVAGEKQGFTLRKDEQLSLRSGTRLSAEFDELARMDEFDRWAAERNQRAERVVSSRYVAADVIGYEDLDDYGYWRWYSDYGHVWIPTRIVAGWSPYRYGRWAWVSPWGWTWIDDAPWGFAPFHYGRWARVHSRWCWVPGPRTARAVYAPALVAWMGTPGLSVSVNIGTHPVGWIPLGPREVYRPAYRSSRDYVVNVNLSNSLLNHDEFERGYRRQPHEIKYGNRNATSVVSADTLREARPVSNHLIGVEARKLQSLDHVPVSRPERGPGVRSTRAVTPPVTANSREVLARRQPMPPNLRDSGTTPPAPVARGLGGIRIINPAVTRRPDGNSDQGDGSRSRSITNRPGDSSINMRSSEELRRQQRDQHETRNETSGVRNRSITTTPPVRPETRPAERGDAPLFRPSRPANEASAPAPAPNVAEPRTRGSWGRDEAPGSGRERNRGSNDNAAPSIQRNRSMPAPDSATPLPRREPALRSPATAPLGGSDSNRLHNRLDENVPRHRHLERGSR